jgi:predicted transcriptional regulator
MTDLKDNIDTAQPTKQDLKDVKIKEVQMYVQNLKHEIMDTVAQQISGSLENNINRGITTELATGLLNTQVAYISKQLDKSFEVLANRMIELIPESDSNG